MSRAVEFVWALKDKLSFKWCSSIQIRVLNPLLCSLWVLWVFFNFHRNWRCQVMAHGFGLNILLLNNASFIPKHTRSPKVHHLLYLQVVVFSLLHPLFAATKTLVEAFSKIWRAPFAHLEKGKTQGGHNAVAENVANTWLAVHSLTWERCLCFFWHHKRLKNKQTKKNLCVTAREQAEQLKVGMTCMFTKIIQDHLGLFTLNVVFYFILLKYSCS